MEMEDEDDPVVKEYPVFMSRHMMHSLIVLQHPVKPAPVNGREEDEPVVEVKYKPNQQRISMKIGLDTRSASFDICRAELLAANSEAGEDADEPSREKMMDYKVLEGILSSKDSRRYAIGRFCKGGVHVAPLDGWFHMRPSFAHVDKTGSVNDDQKEFDAKPDAAGASTSADGELVSIKFARHQTDRAKKAEQRSFAHLHKVSESEPWTNLDYVPRKTNDAASLRHLLLSRNPDPVADASEYEDVKGSFSVMNQSGSAGPEQVFVEGVLCQAGADPTLGAASETPAAGPAGDDKSKDKKPVVNKEVPLVNLSLQQLRIRPLFDRVAAVATRAKILRFSEICELLRPDPEIEIVRALMRCCYLVQGCWVVRSEQLYKNALSGASTNSRRGVPLDVVARSRDFVLYQFTKSRTVDKEKMRATLKLPSAALAELLREFSRPVEKHSSTYEFLFPTDSVFLSSYADIAVRQTGLWETKFNMLEKLLQTDQTTRSSASSPTSSPQRRRRRTRSQRESFSSDADPGPSSSSGR